MHSSQQPGNRSGSASQRDWPRASQLQERRREAAGRPPSAAGTRRASDLASVFPASPAVLCSVLPITRRFSFPGRGGHCTLGHEQDKSLGLFMERMGLWFSKSSETA